MQQRHRQEDEEDEIIARLLTIMCARRYRLRRRRTAHAYLSVPPGGGDAEAKAKAKAKALEDPAATIRGAIHAKLPDLRFEVLPPPPGLGAVRSVRFCSQDDREEAMEFQPFALGVATVWLVRQGETSCKFNDENEPSGAGD
ncbi:hypothetical protein BS78_10G026500 [Paspalum vaginatum]|nr:hypothetical protein BS78_10G026500 [Paspalum vaginatum]